MSTEAGAADVSEAEPPTTPGEVLDWPLERGDVAVHIDKPTWYVILGICDAPAGQIPASAGGTIDEWLECDHSAEIAMAVTVERMKQSVVRFNHVDDVARAVKDGTVTPAGVPTKRLGISLEEFVEAEKRGEWDGLRDYVTDSSTEEVSQ